MQLVCALIPCTARRHRLRTHAPLRAVPSARDAAGNLAAARTQSITAPAAGITAVPTGHESVRSLGAGRGRRQRRNGMRGPPVRLRVAAAATPAPHVHTSSSAAGAAATHAHSTHPAWRVAATTAPAPAVTAAAATSQLVGERGSGGHHGTGARGRPRQLRPAQDRCACAVASTASAPAVTAAAGTK